MQNTIKFEFYFILLLFDTIERHKLLAILHQFMDACICLNSTAVKKIFNGTKNTRLLFFWKEMLQIYFLRASRKQSILSVIEEYFLK